MTDPTSHIVPLKRELKKRKKGCKKIVEWQEKRIWGAAELGKGVAGYFTSLLVGKRP
jgi:hypothetical protein